MPREEMIDPIPNGLLVFAIIILLAFGAILERVVGSFTLFKK